MTQDRFDRLRAIAEHLQIRIIRQNAGNAAVIGPDSGHFQMRHRPFDLGCQCRKIFDRRNAFSAVTYIQHQNDFVSLSQTSSRVV